MSVFPLTSMTLLQKLAVDATDGNEAAWVRFFNLYTPAIRRFVQWNSPTQDPDDVVQEVYVKLVDILRSGKYRPDKARFHTFLTLLIRRQLISLYRKDVARGGGFQDSLDDLEIEPSVPADQAERIDMEWARAKHEAAIEHVLTQVPLSDQTRSVYRAYALEDHSADDVAKRFGISKETVYMTKNRVDKMISVVEAEYEEG